MDQGLGLSQTNKELFHLYFLTSDLFYEGGTYTEKIFNLPLTEECRAPVTNNKIHVDDLTGW